MDPYTLALFLLGAVLAPTDPVLAPDVQVAPPAHVFGALLVPTR